MKRSTLLFSLALAAVILLSACNITIEPAPQPPRPDASVETTNDDLRVSWSDSLRPGESVLIEVEVATNLDLVFLELSEDIALRAQVNSGTSVRRVVASAGSRAFFAEGQRGLSATSIHAGSVVPSSINELVVCGGSCVALPAATYDTVYAHITNTSGSALTVQLRAFGRNLQDTNEDRNNSASNPPLIPFEGDVQGAIETIGDIDYWEIQSQGEVFFNAPNAQDLILSAWVRDLTGEVFGPYVPGAAEFLVESGDILWVESSSDRAAAAGQGAYALSHFP